jgi:cytochrome c553
MKGRRLNVRRDLILAVLLTALSLAALSLMPAAYAADDDEACRTCHTGAARDFDLSTKSAYLSCTDCHGTEHNGPGTGDPGIPTP